MLMTDRRTIYLDSTYVEVEQNMTWETNMFKPSKTVISCNAFEQSEDHSTFLGRGTRNDTLNLIKRTF